MAHLSIITLQVRKKISFDMEEINLSSSKYTGKGNAQNEMITELLRA